jgi:hypothetical protein
MSGFDIDPAGKKPRYFTGRQRRPGASYFGKTGTQFHLLIFKDSLRFQNTGNLISYTGDELVWELDMPINGHLSFIDNWDPD